MSPTRVRLLAALLLGAAAVLAGGAVRGGQDRGAAPTPPPDPLPAEPQPVRTSGPRRGDCGAHTGTTVAPAPCDRRAADVEVALVRLGGDPGAVCPLHRRDAVLVTWVTPTWTRAGCRTAAVRAAGSRMRPRASRSSGCRPCRRAPAA